MPVSPSTIPSMSSSRHRCSLPRMATAFARTREQPLDSIMQRRLIEEAANVVIGHADELTALAQAMGDADHGINMKRGAMAVLERLDELAVKPLPDALIAAGQTLVMKVGGASGPLYGTLLMTLGKGLPVSPSRDELAQALSA